jgi:hypothetical protein
MHSHQKASERKDFFKAEIFNCNTVCWCRFCFSDNSSMRILENFKRQFIYYSYAGESFDFLHPQIIRGLFGWKNGWLPYTPVMIFSLPGIYNSGKAQKPILSAPYLYASDFHLCYLQLVVLELHQRLWVSSYGRNVSSAFIFTVSIYRLAYAIPGFKERVFTISIISCHTQYFQYLPVHPQHSHSGRCKLPLLPGLFRKKPM